MGDTIVLDDHHSLASTSDDDEGASVSNSFDADVVKSEPSDFEEIEDTDGDEEFKDIKPVVKKENSENGKINQSKLTKSDQRKRNREKMEKDKLARVKPDFAVDRERERKLCRIATSGVVQLFNAVGERQAALEKQAQTGGKSEFRRADATAELRADAGDFARRLDGQKKKIKLDDEKVKVETKKEEADDEDMEADEGSESDEVTEEDDDEDSMEDSDSD